MVNPIKAKVAKILNSRELIITAGSTQGVESGMYFDVLDPKGEDIKDPDSGEVLGSVQRPKVRLKITHVQENISVASTYKAKKINIGGSSIFFSNLGTISRALMPPNYVTRYETLKTDEKTWEDLEESKSYVKIGDPVIQVIEEEDFIEPEI